MSEGRPEGDTPAIAQTISTARDIATFAHKQGVGEAIAVDHLIEAYEKEAADNERLRKALEAAASWAVAGGHAIEPRNVLAKVISVVDSALERDAVCTFPSCRCEWSKRHEHCPRYGGATKGQRPSSLPAPSYAAEHGDPGGYGGES